MLNTIQTASDNIHTLCDAREHIIDLLDEFTTIMSEARHETIKEKGSKILTPKQMLQRLPIELAQEKAGDTSDN